MTKKEIGAIVGAKMKEKKVSAYTIKRDTNVQPHVLSAILQGDKGYTMDTLQKVCTLLDLSIAIL